jgi:hypothetical protein
MSDRRLLILALALVARPLMAQDDLALLRRRVANLEAHHLVLARAAAVHDSLAMEADSFRIVGAPPFQVVLPGAAVEGAQPIIDREVASARARFGSIVDRLPPELLRERFDTQMDGDGNLTRETPRQLRERLGYSVAGSLEARVSRQLPDSFGPWIGGRLPVNQPGLYRSRAITRLLSDSTGQGIRCLEGEVVTCRALLGRSPMAHELRASLVANIVAERGVESWGRMAGGGAADEALVRGAGEPMDSIVQQWVDALRTEPTNSPLPFTLLLTSALGWTVLLATLFLWRVKWHHA